MIDFTLLLVFIPTFILVSATPGLCMTLSLTLGMSIGVKRALWMMYGELLGVALVSILAVVGVAQIMLNHPVIFIALKYLGGSYLIYSGIQQWQQKFPLSLPAATATSRSNRHLFAQGWITAIANPKGWAFMVSLLPPFINTAYPIEPQLFILVSIILVTEFFFLLLYANGGQKLKQVLEKTSQHQRLYQLSGTLLCLIGLWLIVTTLV